MTTERILLGEIVGIEKLHLLSPTSLEKVKVTVLISAADIRIKELRVGIECTLGYEVK